MKGKRFTSEQIIRIIKESEIGIKNIDICRKYGISEQTFYNWKSKYGGMEVSDGMHLKVLEDENRKLKGIVADLAVALGIKAAMEGYRTYFMQAMPLVASLLLRQLKMSISGGIGNFRTLEVIANMRRSFNEHFHKGTGFRFQVFVIADGFS
jgi:putative transposase